MTAAAVALVALIGWLAGVQTVRVGRDRSAPPSTSRRTLVVRPAARSAPPASIADR